MSKVELIEDYLMNRLNPAEQVDFEKSIKSDSSLRAELDAQKAIIESIKKARVLELKSMLNNVPVAPTVDFTNAKIIGSIISIGVIGVLTYFYFLNPGELITKTDDLSEITIDVPTPIIDNSVEPFMNNNEDRIAPPVAQPEKSSSPPSETAEPGTEMRPVPQPQIQVTDPSKEISELSGETNGPEVSQPNSTVTPSQIEIFTDSSNRRYSFHYQLTQGRLMLYGLFDKGLYEILEINGSTRTVFLYYDNHFYFLKDGLDEILPLEPVTDTELLRKLKEYREI